MRKHLHKLFAISMALALGLMAQAQTQFQAVVPSGQTLYFKTTGATTCGVWTNDNVVGDLVIPETVEHEGTTYRVTSMVSFAFEPYSNYNDLTSVVIPSSITYLPKGVFWRCEGLKSVWLPPTLTSIGASAFRGCKSLTKVIIPASVNSIGAWAFASDVFPGEMALDTVIFLREDPPTTFGQDVFHTGESRTVKIWVPLHRTRPINPYIGALEGQTPVSFTYTVYDCNGTPAHVNHIYDTIHPGESRTFAGRILTAGGDYTDSTWYYTHDSLITLHLTVVPWHFYATVPSGQSLRFEVTSPTTCQLAGNNSMGGSATDSLIIPYTVSDGTNTYQVTAIGGSGIEEFLGRGTLILPNSITRIEWNGINYNDFNTIIFPAGLNFMDNGAVRRSARTGSSSVLVFRSATPPAVKSSYLNAFTNGYTANAVQHIYVPAGQSAAYQSAFNGAFPNATLHEWGTVPTAVGSRTDTIHPGGTYILNGRYITAAGIYTDSAFFYTHDSLTTVHLVRVDWHFSVDTLGNRLWYRIIGTDRVEVVPPNTFAISYSGYTEPSGNLDIPDTVRHGGTAYAVVKIGPYAFYSRNRLDGYISLPPTIDTIGKSAFEKCFAVRKIVIPASVISFGNNCFRETMTYGEFDTIVFLASDASDLRSWDMLFGIGSWDSKILVPCGSMANYSTAPDIPAAYLQEYGCPVVVHIYDTMCAGATYHWANKAIISGGTFYDTVHLPLYDSVTILHLATEGNWNNSHTLPDVYCETSLPLTWRGQNIDAPGDYTHDERVLTPRGCWLSGRKYEMTVFQRPHTYVYDTVVHTAKGNDYSDTTETTVPPVNYYGPCRDSLVTTITWHDFDETTDTVRTIYDTLFYAMGPVTFAGRSITSPGEYRDTIHLPGYDSINILFVSEVHYSFYADAPTGQRLYYRITGADSVEVMAPNGRDWSGYLEPNDTLTIPAAVSHAGSSYRVISVDTSAFAHCLITVLTLQEGIEEVKTEAFVACHRMRYISLPRSLRTIGDRAFMLLNSTMQEALLNDTLWAATIGERAFEKRKLRVQGLVLPNVRTIGVQAFRNVDNLQYLYVGDSCITIGQYAFANALSNGRVSFGTSLNSVGEYALRQTSQHLQSVEFHRAPPPSFGDDVFWNTQVDSIITPCGTSSAYRTALYFSSPSRWDPSNTLFQERGCDVVVDIYDTVCEGTIYDFGGRYLFRSGTYYDTVRMPFRDSITVLHLEVEGTMANIVNTDEICETGLPYIWDGDTITTPGTHYLDHSVFNPRGCLMSGNQLRLTVTARAHTYIYDTVVSTAKGYDYDDTTTVSLLYQGLHNGPCPDSLVTTYTHYDLDESIDTLRVSFTHLQCDGTYLFAGVERTATGIYTDTVVVDPFHVTISTLDLTINYSNTGDTAAVVCDAFTWYGVDYTASATPQQVFTNAAGCDSTVTLALTVNYSNTGDTAAVVCDDFTWHGVDYTASAAPQHVYTNAAGCDSTVTLALTVNYSNTGMETADVCDEYTWQGTTYTFSNTTDQMVLTNAAGCDSTVTLNLTVRHSSVGDTAVAAFDAFTWYGHTYRATTTATHTLVNAVGCDSTVTLRLTILEGYSTDATYGENGIDVEAYGYCAGPGAVRYRLSSGQPNEYRLAFAHEAFPAADWMPIATSGSIDIEVPAGLVTGDYSATLQFRHSSWPELTSAAIPVVIHVNLPETYVQPLFNDVIALVDTCQCLTDVQWYHREEGETEWTLIPGANDYYYHQEGGLTGEYFVSAKMNGVETYTCPQSDMGTLISDGDITLTAYPNPTASVVTLTLDGSRRASHEVRVLTTTGIELERLTFDGDSLQMDLSAYPRGSYIVSVDGMAVRVIRN